MHALFLLLVQLVPIIAVARLFARLLRPLGQPAVIGEILAGIALGPSVLGWLAPAVAEVVFPAEAMPGLALVSQLGLVLFMFLVGLEFDPKLLEGRGRASVLISQSSIVVPFGLGAALAWALHGDLAPAGVPFLPFALFMGVAMSVTAFPVLARILTERGMLRTEIGAISLACAAVDDVTAWCLLAFVVAVAEAEGLRGALVTTALTGVYAAVMVGVVRPLLAPLGPRGGSDVSPDLLAGVCMLLFASAAVTEWIGIHALFGAFALGAIVPRDGGLVRGLAAKIEDLVTVALLPLFFAYSGLRTQIGLLGDPADWLTCAGIVAVACAGKFGGGALAARVTGLRWREASAIGILMNTRGLVELVVLNIGLDLGILSERLFAMLVLMALVTTWTTSPLLGRLYPRPRPLTAGGPGTLLCLSDPAIAPAMVAVGEALVRGTGRELWALHVAPLDRPSVYLREDAPEALGPLAAIRAVADARGLAVKPIALAATDAIDEIARIAVEREAGIVVVGGQRAALGGPLSGAVGQLLERLPTEVVVLEDRGLRRIGRVTLAGGDGPDLAAARDVAERLGRAAGEGDAELVVVPHHAAEVELPRHERAAAVAIVRNRR